MQAPQRPCCSFKPSRAFCAVYGSSCDQARWLRRPAAEVLGIHAPFGVKMSFVAESDLPQEVDVVVAAPREPAAVELP